MYHCVSERSLSFEGKINEKQYCSVLHEYEQQEAIQSGLPTFPRRFLRGQKRRKHIQEALVKETVLNDGVAGPEQRGVLSIGRDVCYTTVKRTLLELISFHQQGKKGSCPKV